MATQLGEMAVGSIVKLNVDGVPTNFIVVQQGIPKNNTVMYSKSCNGTWILAKDIYSLDKFGPGKIYAPSYIHSFLNSSFFYLLDESIRTGGVRFVRIPYVIDEANTVNSGENGLACNIFLLSLREVGLYANSNEGEILDYFNINGDASKERRIAKYNGTAQSYWGRTGSAGESGNSSYIVTQIGEQYYNYYGNKDGIRPAMILNFSLWVLDDGTITTNQPPEAPASITVPELVKGGGELLVSWAAAADPDGDPVSYELERKTDAADWAQIYKGDQLSFTDQITKGWLSVQYRVRAVDSGNLSSGWTESELRTVDNNAAPVIECEHPGGADLGEKAEPFAVNYTVTDPDAEDQNALTVTETVDGQTTRTETQAESGAAFEAAALNDPAEFQKLLNGPHTLSITASDGKAQTTHTLTFTKKVTSASVTLSEPLAVEGDITLAALRVSGSIPADALFTVEVTNNGADDQPVWQDVTAEVKRGANIVFTNHTAAKGAAFNFRVNVSRGPSGQGGYISAITGAFQ